MRRIDGQNEKKIIRTNWSKYEKKFNKKKNLLRRLSNKDHPDRERLDL